MIKNAYKFIGFAVVAAIVFLMAACPMYNDIDTEGIPQFISVNYVDPSEKDENDQYVIYRISRFRSSEGHDFSDKFEKNRSMKHYFWHGDSTTKMYSPVNGTIMQYSKENHANSGYQIRIKSKDYPAFTFMLFHVAPIKTFVFGEKVTAGQLLGYHGHPRGGSDIKEWI